MWYRTAHGIVVGNPPTQHGPVPPPPPPPSCPVCLDSGSVMMPEGDITCPMCRATPPIYRPRATDLVFCDWEDAAPVPTVWR